MEKNLIKLIWNKDLNINNLIFILVLISIIFVQMVFKIFRV